MRRWALLERSENSWRRVQQMRGVVTKGTIGEFKFYVRIERGDRGCQRSEFYQWV